MAMIRLAYMLGVALVTASCGKWPPHSGRIAAHLDEHGTAMDELFSAFTGTQYRSMYYVIDEGIFVEPHPQGTRLGGTLLVGSEAERFRQLMDSADVFAIDRTAEHAWTDMRQSTRGTDYEILLVYDEPTSEHWKLCEAEHSTSDCGYCDVDLGDPWRIKYSWHPTGLQFWNLDACMATGIAFSHALHGSQEETPLHRAAATNGNLDIVSALIAAGSDVNARTLAFGETPLHLAVSNNASPAIITALIDAGADIDDRRYLDGRTPLHLAGRHNASISVVTALLDAGADLQALDLGELTPLHDAASHGNPELVAVLLEAGAAVSPTQGSSLSVLHSAAMNPDPAVIGSLIAAGGDVHARDAFGMTLLHVAAFNGNPHVIPHLLDSSVALNVPDAEGATELHYAASYGSEPMLAEALVRAGSDPNAPDKYGATSLHIAALASREAALIDLLVNAGADVNALRGGIPGRTPLYEAIKFNPVPTLIAALADAGADPTLQDRYGMTPRDYADYNEELRESDVYRRLSGE